jgi:phosphatidylserine decarboxylase
MTMNSSVSKLGVWRRLLLQEDLNFLLTNRVPRMALTRWMGWFSQIRSPLLARASIAVWRLFTDLDLTDAKPQRYASLHECFIRQLKDGARAIDADPQVLASPCDAIVGQCGAVQGTQVFQAKGFPYRLADLFGPSQDSTPFHDGLYVTLRLTSAMYHRFHAPHDLQLQHVTHLTGDTWNVNPIARLESSGQPIALVPVAAILVASLRLHALDLLLHARWPGPHELPCDAKLSKGQEMGWFQHGSTLIVFVPRGFSLAPGIAPGARIRMGQALMRLPLLPGLSPN